MARTPFEGPQISLDIEDLRNTKRGQKVYNALLASSAEIIRTKRGRLAMLMRQEVFLKLQKQLRVQLVSSYDGLQALVLEPDSNKDIT